VRAALSLALVVPLGAARADELLPATPEGWSFERLELPLSFAPDLELEGFEELRFAPGMFEPGSAGYFSYALALRIEGEVTVDEAFLRDFLARYYRGLCQAVGAGRPEGLDLSGFAVELAPEDAGWRARIDMVDAFVTGQPLRLDLSLQVDPRPGRTEVLGIASPHPREAPIWRDLDAIAERWRAARPAALFLNHLYVIPDAETYRALAASSFLRETFAVVEERTTVRRDMTYSGLYLYGRDTYFEFLPPDGPIPEGSSGLAFGVDVAGGMGPLEEAWKQDGLEGFAGPVTRRLGEADLPWFRMWGAPPAREGSKLSLFAMEYDPRFLESWHADLPPRAGGVTRRAVLARYAAHLAPERGEPPLLRDVVEVRLEVDEPERERLVQVVRAGRWVIEESGAERRCLGPPARDSSSRATRRPCRSSAEHPTVDFQAQDPFGSPWSPAPGQRRRSLPCPRPGREHVALLPEHEHRPVIALRAVQVRVRHGAVVEARSHADVVEAVAVDVAETRYRHAQLVARAHAERLEQHRAGRARVDDRAAGVDARAAVAPGPDHQVVVPVAVDVARAGQRVPEVAEGPGAEVHAQRVARRARDQGHAARLLPVDRVVAVRADRDVAHAVAVRVARVGHPGAEAAPRVAGPGVHDRTVRAGQEVRAIPVERADHDVLDAVAGQVPDARHRVAEGRVGRRSAARPQHAERRARESARATQARAAGVLEARPADDEIATAVAVEVAGQLEHVAQALAAHAVARERGGRRGVLVHLDAPRLGAGDVGARAADGDLERAVPVEVRRHRRRAEARAGARSVDVPQHGAVGAREERHRPDVAPGGRVVEHRAHQDVRLPVAVHVPRAHHTAARVARGLALEQVQQVLRARARRERDEGEGHGHRPGAAHEIHPPPRPAKRAIARIFPAMRSFRHQLLDRDRESSAANPARVLPGRPRRMCAAMLDDDPPPTGFRTTRWTVVLEAGRGEAGGRAALEELCGTYWYPLYALARRRGFASDGAQDAVQGFFADLLARGDVARADPERGRFRAFLAKAFTNHLANARDAARAQKRGGGRVALPLDGALAEERYEQASGRALDPVALFDRAWALALIEEALAGLRADYARRGRSELFDALRPVLLEPDGGATDRAALARSLALTDGALKVALHRLRGRARDALRAAVRDTVARDEEVETELARLFAALGG